MLIVQSYVYLQVHTMTPSYDMDIQPEDLWIAAGVLLGFQVASFAAHINREVAVGKVHFENPI
jgi:hypothetical protein